MSINSNQKNIQKIIIALTTVIPIVVASFKIKIPNVDLSFYLHLLGLMDNFILLIIAFIAIKKRR